MAEDPEWGIDEEVEGVRVALVFTGGSGGANAEGERA